MNKLENDNKFFQGWIMVAACFVLLSLYAGAGFYTFSIFIKPLEESFGWSRSAISFAMSIYMMCHGLVAPIIGHLTETYGPKKVMSFFAAGTGTAFILVSFTNSLWHFYGGYFMPSFMNTGIGYIPVSSVLARWFVRKRGTAIGVAMVGFAAGGLIMTHLVSHINQYLGWRISFLFMGILVWAISLPLTFFVIKGSPSEVGLTPDGDESEIPERSFSKKAEQGWPLRQALRSRAFPWIFATFLLAPFAQLGILQHQVPILFEFGFSEATAATALGLTAGLGGVGKLAFGRISEIIPFHKAAMLCFGLQALSVLILLQVDSPFFVWLYVLIFGIAMGGVIVLLPISIVHFFGLASFGVLMGIVSFSQAVGSASGTYILGFVYDYFGTYEYGLIFYIGIYLIAILTIFLAGKPKEYS